MVAKRGQRSISSEFKGGLLPLGGGPEIPPPAPLRSEETRSVQKPIKQRHAGTMRKKVTLYLNDPEHIDLMEDLLSALRRTHNLARDNSMLMRALLDRARSALEDPDQLEELAGWCSNTMPER